VAQDLPKIQLLIFHLFVSSRLMKATQSVYDFCTFYMSQLYSEEKLGQIFFVCPKGELFTFSRDEISGSYCGKCEDDCLLGRCALQSGTN
jgi:hypothetical protein